MYVREFDSQCTQNQIQMNHISGRIHGASCVAMFQVLNAKMDNLQRMVSHYC